jgi:hypothetical protein
LRDHAGDEFGIANRGEVHKPHAVRIPIEQFGTDAYRQSRLAHAARTNQRDQRVLDKQRFDVGNIVLAADEGRRDNWEIVRFDRAARWLDRRFGPVLRLMNGLRLPSAWRETRHPESLPPHFDLIIQDGLLGPI